MTGVGNRGFSAFVFFFVHIALKTATFFVIAKFSVICYHTQ